MDSEGGDSNSPTFHGMDFEGADSNSPTFHGVYPGLLVAPIGPPELGVGGGLPNISIDPPAFEEGADAGPLVEPIGPPVLGIYVGLLGPPIAGAGVGLPDVPIDPPALEAGADAGPIVAPVGLPVLVAEIDGGLLCPIGPLGFGIHAGLLGPPIDGVYAGLLVAPISQPELGAGVGLPDVPIDTLAFEAGANAGPLVAPFGPPMLGPVRRLLFVKKLTISDLLDALSVPMEHASNIIREIHERCHINIGTHEFIFSLHTVVGV